MQHARDDEPHDREADDDQRVQHGEHAAARSRRPCRPCGRAGTCGRPPRRRRARTRPAGRRPRARRRPRSRPWRSRASEHEQARTASPAAGRRSRRPDCPSPPSVMSRPVARATSAALGKVPSSQARGTRSATSDHRSPFCPAPGSRFRGRRSALAGREYQISTHAGECQAGPAGSHDADLRVPLRQVRRGRRGVPVVLGSAAHQARGLRRQAREGAVARRHRAEGLGLLQDRQPQRSSKRGSKAQGQDGLRDEGATRGAKRDSSSVVGLRLVELEVVGLRRGRSSGSSEQSKSDAKSA